MLTVLTQSTPQVENKEHRHAKTFFTYNRRTQYHIEHVQQ
jgi:hypothetical protein